MGQFKEIESESESESWDGKDYIFTQKWQRWGL